MVGAIPREGTILPSVILMVHALHSATDLCHSCHFLISWIYQTHLTSFIISHCSLLFFRQKLLWRQLQPGVLPVMPNNPTCVLTTMWARPIPYLCQTTMRVSNCETLTILYMILFARAEAISFWAICARNQRFGKGSVCAIPPQVRKQLLPSSSTWYLVHFDYLPL